MSTQEFSGHEEIFEKPRGQRRWLNKHHHRGKERLYSQVKDRAFIKMTTTAMEPSSTKSSTDGLAFNLEYSFDKKKRWKMAENINLFISTNGLVDAEVIDKKAQERLIWPSKEILTVHSRSEESHNRWENEPTVTVNIITTHKSSEMVGSKLYKGSKVVTQTAKHRANKKFDLENYDDEYEEELYSEEEEIENDIKMINNQVDLCDFIVEKRSNQSRKRNN